MENENKVIAGASVYNEKYFISSEYSRVPEEVLKELKDICILYAQKLHCIFTVNFNEDGEIYFETRAEEWDYHFDEIGAKLDIDKLMREKRTLINALNLWYRVFVKKEKIDLDVNSQ